MLCFNIEFYILNGKEVSFTERLCHIAEEISCRLSTKSFSSPTCKALAYKNLVPRSLVDEAVANIFTWLALTCGFDDKRSGYEINAHCLISNFSTSISVVSFSFWFISFCDSSLSSAWVKRFLSSSNSFSNDAILVCCSMFFSDQLLLSCSSELCASDNESNWFCRSIRRFSRVFFYQKERFERQ